MKAIKDRQGVCCIQAYEFTMMAVVIVYDTYLVRFFLYSMIYVSFL